MSSSTSSLIDSSLQHFSRLISSGRLAVYEHEVALVLWEYELRRLRRWAEEVVWWSLIYELVGAPGIEDQLFRILHRLQQALAEIQDVLDNNTADEAMSAETNDNDVGRTKMQMIYLSLRETISCMNQMIPIIQPVRRPAFDPTILRNEAVLSVLLRAPDLSRGETAAQQLFALWSHLRTTLVPLCECLMREPPPDLEVRESLHKKLKETILAQLTLAGTIGISDDDGSRDLRQAMTTDAQSVLSKLDKAIQWYKQVIWHYPY